MRGKTLRLPSPKDRPQSRESSVFGTVYKYDAMVDYHKEVISWISTD